MNKSDKIREYFRKHPEAEASKVAAKFQASKPMTYKLRKQIQEEWKPPAALPVPPISSWAKIMEEVEAEAEETDIDETLDARAQDYGKFKDGAALMQGIKRLLADHAASHDKTFADDQWEALEMIVHKIGRIVNGNPDKVDHWVDIAGYAKLVADRLEGVER
jgi:hypothetical protein